MRFQPGSARLAWAVSFAALCLPVHLRASQVLITITGTVSGGEDQQGYFIPKGTDFSGQGFTLIYTFDDTKGMQGNNGAGGAPSETYIESTGSSNPGTAVITINGKSYAWGVLSISSISSSVLKFIQPAASGGGNLQVNVGEFYTAGGSSAVQMSIRPATGTILSADVNWEGAFSNSNLLTNDFGDFIIHSPTAFVQGNLYAQTVTVSGPLNPANGKTLGTCTSCTDDQTTNASSVQEPSPNSTGTAGVGDPINIATGNAFEAVIDYRTAGANPLSFKRFYNSIENTLTVPTLSRTLGTNWRSNYDRYLQSSASTTTVERPDGRILTFTLNNGAWTSDSDIDVKLTQSSGTWTLTDVDDTVETYSTQSALFGTLVLVYERLDSIKARNGYTQTLSYNASNQLISVTDSYSRSLALAYSGGMLSTVTTPDGLVLTYGYSGTLLTSVAYSTTPQTSQTYLYENASFPNALTGIIDENGSRFATWTYDTQGRALTSQHGAGADLTTIVYDDATGNRTVTSALGQQGTYKFTTLQNVPKLTEIDRLASTTTAAATRTFTYDANGYMASQTDWNGNRTTYVNDAHGQPTSIVEASGTAQARTTTVTYHSTFHLPVNFVTPGLTSAFTYDGSGELLTRTLTDTTTTSVPYSTGGTTRTWIYTWSNFLLASAKGPRTDANELTSFTYDSSGALTAVTNALVQVTKITTHTSGGLPLTIVDPNSVTTTLTYDTRQRFLTSTLSTGAGPLTTTLTYDAVGNLTKTTLPDGSALSNTYDTAHRLSGTTDLFSNGIAYTLDAAGDRTNTAISNAGGTKTRQHTTTFDALGRILHDIGGVGQTTAYAYDANGNAATVTDPLSHATQRNFDALNRVFKITDPASGNTGITYDPHDRPLSVTDPIGNTTSYTYNGFGDLIQEVSPARGTTVYHYDLDGNLVEKVDARGAVANYSYDALNRRTATTFPANAAENIAYTYDQAAGGLGIGKLTSVSDAVGSLSRTYDERGKVLTETRVHGGSTLLTNYTYDAASRLASITYPSGWTVGYTRDAMGKTIAMTTKAPGSGTTATTIISGITYQPFGPDSAMTYGNGITQSRSFDPDYRITNLTATGSSPVQKLDYGYDAADNILSIADGVTSGNSQNLGYDVLNRLTGATGAYASLGYSYDANGNRLTENPTSAAAPSLDGLGSVSALTYNQSGRLATVSAGNQQLTQYTYDAFGHRTVKIGSVTATTLYQYDSAGQLLEENDGAGTSRVDYVYIDDQPIATIQPTTGKLYFLHDDRLGAPQLGTDASQKVQWTATYQPFGYTSTGFGVIVQNIRLLGQEFDAETGLNHNGFRAYVAGLGRYLESDRIGLAGGLNTFAYARSNPLRFTDRSGLDPANGFGSSGSGSCPSGSVLCTGSNGNVGNGSCPSGSILCLSSRSSDRSIICDPLTNPRACSPDQLYHAALKKLCGCSAGAKILNSIGGQALYLGLDLGYAGFVGGEFLGGPQTLGLSGIGGAAVGGIVGVSIGGLAGAVSGSYTALGCAMAGAYSGN